MTNWALYGILTFHFYHWNQLKVILLDSRVRRRSVPSKFIALIVYLFIASWSIYRLTSDIA